MPNVGLLLNPLMPLDYVDINPQNLPLEFKSI